jgi:ADP-heptose:LPS heptosyltransferase
MCFSLPAVRSLVTAGNNVRILCVERQAAFWNAAGFGELITYPENASARVIAPLVTECKRVLLWEAGPAADACARAGVAERIGLPSPKLEKRLTKFLNRRVRPGPAEHRVQLMLDTAELLGAEPLQGIHFVPIPSSLERRPRTMLAIPESDFGDHYEWPKDRWIEVLTQLKDQGWTIEVGSIRKGGAASAIASSLELETVDLDPTQPALLSTYEFCLSADGSYPHLAGAFGTTCGILFGPGDPVLSRPLSQRHIIIRRKVECSPCFLDKCPIDLRCQNDLDVERVLDRLQALNPA